MNKQNEFLALLKNFYKLLWFIWVAMISDYKIFKFQQLLMKAQYEDTKINTFCD